LKRIRVMVVDDSLPFASAVGQFLGRVIDLKREVVDARRHGLFHAA